VLRWDSGAMGNADAELAYTRSQLASARALREELKSTRQHESCTSLLSQASVSCSTFGGSGLSAAQRPCGSQTTALEDRLKKRMATEKNLAAALQNRMVSVDHTIFDMRQQLTNLTRTSQALWKALNVAEKRLELRAQRPAQESGRDHFQEALESERTELHAAHERIADELARGAEVQQKLDALKASMHSNKLTLHLDRSPWPVQFLEGAKGLEESAAQFRSNSAKVLQATEATASQASRRTADSMNRRISEEFDMKKRLEEEITENRMAINQAGLNVDRISKQIRRYRSAPENRFKGDGSSPVDLEHFNNTAVFDPSMLSNVRAKIKAAAYAGHAGRQLDVLFNRFDRDGSGELDEDEVRRALRRTLRIPPSSVTDAEISALCTTLDADHSGTVSIRELLDFLSADVDIRALEQQFATLSSTLEKLEATHQEMTANLQRKSAAWTIDRSCLAVTAIKGLELHAMAEPITPHKPASARPGRRQKPLEPRILEKMRLKLQRAAQARGRGMEELLRSFDLDGTGQLELHELRKAVRSKLGVPSYAISDAEISSLCAMLDADDSGAVSVAEVLDFVRASDSEASSERQLPAICSATSDSSLNN